MKNRLLYIVMSSVMMILFPKFSFSQSVAINADSSVADASAILDLKSTKKGLLVPRMTMVQRDSIASPALGLLIYQTDNTAGYYYYNGSLWTPLKSSGGGSGTGNYWSANDGDDIFNTNIGNVGIGTVLPKSRLYVKTPLNSTGFTHLGVTDSIGTDSLILSDKLFSSYQVRNGGFTTTIPGAASFGTDTKHALRFHSGDSGWLNIIPDGSVVIGDSAGYHGYYGSKLSVRTDAGAKGVSVISSDGALVSMVSGAASSGIGTFTSSDMNIYTNSAPAITITADGSVGVGSYPLNRFQIGDLGIPDIYNKQFAVGNGNVAFGMEQTDDATTITSQTNINLLPIFGGGNVGIGTNNPVNKLQIGNFGFAGYSGTDFAIGTGNDAMNMSAYGIQSTGNFDINPNGNVGIKTTQIPANKLQVGFLGPQGYNGNDIAFGNGYHTTAIAQTNDYVQIASSTNMALLPKYGTGGFVGINTAYPRAPLDVESYVNMPAANPSVSFAYYGFKFDDFHPAADFGGTSDNANVSIFASNNVMAMQFDAFSDERIKTITGISNTLEDLRTLNNIQITNYTFKDKIKNGSRLYKKVIAQQVERVYPQIVSKHKDVVPNVYQLTSNIQKQSDGYLLTFDSSHHISSSAKRLQVIMNDNTGRQYFDIISIPSSTQVIIKATDLKADKLFVYGEEVDDFRTVDYEGLTTLNISATQELSKQITDLQKTVAEQKEQIKALLKAVNAMKQPEITKK